MSELRCRPTWATPDFIREKHRDVICTFVVLRNYRIWDYEGPIDHTSLLAERPELAELESGETLCEWRGAHTLNSGYITEEPGKRVAWLWLKPESGEIDALQEQYGLNEICWYDGSPRYNHYVVLSVSDA
jgi:hypothetical protein